MPDQATVEIRKAKRGDRVYIDVLQNARGHHAVPPYVLRAVPAASVSTPLDWKEVTPDLDPARSRRRRSSAASPGSRATRWRACSSRDARGRRRPGEAWRPSELPVIPRPCGHNTLGVTPAAFRRICANSSAGTGTVVAMSIRGQGRGGVTLKRTPRLLSNPRVRPRLSADPGPPEEGRSGRLNVAHSARGCAVEGRAPKT